MFYINWIARFRFQILAAGIFAVIVGLWSAMGLDLDPSFSSRFLKDNPHLAAYREFQKDFGEEPLLMVVWEGNSGIWEPGSLARIGELTQRLGNLKGIDSAISVASLEQQIKGGDPAGDINRLKMMPMVRKLLVGREGNKGIVALVPSGGSVSPGAGLALVKSVKKAVTDFAAEGERAYVTGPLALQSEAIELSRVDLARAIAIVLFAGAAIFLFVYRSWQPIAASMLVTAVAVAGACGIAASAHLKLSQFALIAIPILAAICLEDVVYIIEHFVNARERGEDLSGAMSSMISASLVPCTWTAFTTCAGFAAILSSDSEQIRSIGLIVLLGAPLALGASLICVPALLCAFPIAARATRRISRERVARAVAFLNRRARWITAAFAVAALAAGYGMRYSTVNLDFPGIFRDSVPFQQQLAEADSELAGAASFEIVMEAKDGGSFLDREKIEAIRNLQTALSLTAPVVTTVSPIDVGITAYLLKHPVPGNPKALSAGIEEVAKRIGAESAPELAGWVSPDYGKARVHVRVRADRRQYYDQLLATLDYLDEGMERRGIGMSWGGLALLYKGMESRMIMQLLESSAIAFAGVLVILMLFFRSAKWGLITILPNILPIAMTVGIMGWLGIGFSLGLVILPAVGLGLIVDDTIHIVWGIKRLVKGGAGVEQAVTEVISTSGRALVLSSAMLVAGFASLAVSPFVSNVQLAILMTLLILLALVFDIAGVPAIYFLLERCMALPASESPPLHSIICGTHLENAER